MISLNPITPENDKLLQAVFSQMAEDIPETRACNLITKYIKHYRQAEDYLNDSSLIYKWHGAGRMMLEIVSRFLEDFYRAYQAIVGGHPGQWLTRLTAIDYPFLTPDEQVFVVSFLQSEGRYPVLFLACCYFQRTTYRQAQVFARANGILNGHTSFDLLAEEYGLTRERVRQVSNMSIVDADDAAMVWDKERWEALGFLHQAVLTETNIHWDELRVKERLDDIDLSGALAIFRQVVPLHIVALRADGRRANSRLSSRISWQTPDVLFAYDRRLECFSFENALAVVGHEACLQRINDSSMPLAAIVDPHFIAQHSDDDRKAVIGILREVLPQFNSVETSGDNIVFRANRTNYIEEIYQILQRKGQAMTIDAIYEEFRQRHPDDHHTDNSFIRSYMLRDNRFQAVGSKSTYQLREWERFAGALGDLAAHLLADSAEPVKSDMLSRQMMELRPATTLKSCNTSIYIAVSTGRLMFYIDNEAGEEAVYQEEPEMCRYYVGLFERQYPERFWPSPLTVEGLLRSMRRFLEQYGRWPFSTAKSGIEHSLYYSLRKYGKKRCVTDEELARYQQGMADINPNEYPSNERDLQFLNCCRELTAFCQQHHHLPVSGKLLTWYHSQCSQAGQFTDFRKYHFDRLRSAITASHRDLPTFSVKPAPQSAEQLSLDFSED